MRPAEEVLWLNPGSISINSRSTCFRFIQMQRPTTVAIGGFASEVGKTTLMCDLLSALPGWEAIKTTRGHYRSCGKDPEACCVSHLLTHEPVVHSGREATYSAGKDTGRYWDAGAANVHWLIATDEQIEKGIRLAMQRVTAAAVLVEGNSFTEFVPVDFLLMVARAEGGTIKGSARRALPRVSALYLSVPDEGLSGANAATRVAKMQDSDERQRFAAWRSGGQLKEWPADLPVYTQTELPGLVSELRRIQQAIAACTDSVRQTSVRR